MWNKATLSAILALGAWTAASAAEPAPKFTKGPEAKRDGQAVRHLKPDT